MEIKYSKKYFSPGENITGSIFFENENNDEIQEVLLKGREFYKYQDKNTLKWHEKEIMFLNKKSNFESKDKKKINFYLEINLPNSFILEKFDLVAKINYFIEIIMKNNANSKKFDVWISNYR